MAKEVKVYVAGAGSVVKSPTPGVKIIKVG